MAWSIAERRRLATQIAAALIQQGRGVFGEDGRRALALEAIAIVGRIAWEVELWSNDVSGDGCDDDHSGSWDPDYAQPGSGNDEDA